MISIKCKKETITNDQSNEDRSEIAVGSGAAALTLELGHAVVSKIEARR